MDAHIEKTQEKVIKASAEFVALKQEVHKVMVGQESAITSTLIALLCGGHVLFEGPPGVAKTTLVKSFADALGISFSRIQFTPDLLPADLLGSVIYNPKQHEFETKKGPIFAHLVLADEINRSPAKVQAALLEAMQERQVTIGSQTHRLEEPFLVFATQNPIENEGTYELPEAQVDRFMFKVIVGYPTLVQEQEILHRFMKAEPYHAKPVMSKESLLNWQKLVYDIHVDPKVMEYILALIFATRQPDKYGLQEYASMISYGVSPRASLALLHASKAQALLSGRVFVTPDDVKSVAVQVLRHRILLTYHAQAEGVDTDTIISKIFAKVITP